MPGVVMIRSSLPMRVGDVTLPHVNIILVFLEYKYLITFLSFRYLSTARAIKNIILYCAYYINLLQFQYFKWHFFICWRIFRYKFFNNNISRENKLDREVSRNSLMLKFNNMKSFTLKTFVFLIKNTTLWKKNKRYWLYWSFLIFNKKIIT